MQTLTLTLTLTHTLTLTESGACFKDPTDWKKKKKYKKKENRLYQSWAAGIRIRVGCYGNLSLVDCISSHY